MKSVIEREVGRGAAVNALGLIAKTAGPAFLIVIARLYGPEALGIYLTAAALVETALAFLVAGFKDGALIFVARHAREEPVHPKLYEALVNAVAWSILMAMLAVAAIQILGDLLILKLYATFGEALLPVLKWMCAVLPLMAVERVIMGATQGLGIMKYEAFVGGGLRPVLLLITASLFWLIAPGLSGLIAAYVTTQVLIFLAALQVYRREFSGSRLWQAARRFRVNHEMISFAFPQNVNVAFDRFVTNVDVIMLGMLGFSAVQTGFYGAGALIVRELRQVKLVFSSAFSPHIVRLFGRGDLDELSRTLATTSRWIATPLIAILLGLAVLRSDVLHLVHPDFGGREATFMLFLLVIPYLQATFGLASNVVVMTGHSRWNLFNGLSAGIANIILNLLLIPSFGLEGAAAASAITATLKSALEVGEMQILLKVRVWVSQLYQPHLAGLIAALALVVWSAFFDMMEGSVLLRCALALCAIILYWAALKLLGGAIRQSNKVGIDPQP